MRVPLLPTALLTAGLTALVPLSAYANTTCCETGGQTWCDDGLPPICVGKAYRVLNSNGVVIRQVDAPLTPEQQAKRDAELARQKIEAQQRAEQEQQDRKLLMSYPTLNDLTMARDRSLTDIQKNQQQLEQKLAALKKQQQKLANDAAFYNEKHPMPAPLKLQIDGNDQDMQAQQDAIAARAQDMVDTQKKFEADEQRYLQLTTKSPR
ncbi:MAG TPA: hypothetical protein VL550_08880 [Rhodocyclaceae bacterium]|nr:hypothetical protein [Rhodocyclaceae bacterium]